MQDHLVASYLSVIKFWARAEKQFSMPRLICAVKGVTSVSNKNLDEILGEIREQGNSITALVPIVQEGLRRGENRDILEEQRKIHDVLSGLTLNYTREYEGKLSSFQPKYLHTHIYIYMLKTSNNFKLAKGLRFCNGFKAGLFN